MMDLATAAILTSIYKLAEQVGAVDYIKKLPEKTVDTLYQRLLQDTVFEQNYLNKLFRPPGRKAVRTGAGQSRTPKSRH